MKVKPELLDFINKNKDLINNEEFGELYDKAGRNPDIIVGELTTVLHQAGIHPLNNLDFIPDKFLNYTTIKSFTIPNYIKKIGFEAFQGCENLEYLDIPNGVTEIGARAFELCLNIRTINIPESVTYLGDQIFAQCEKLSNVKLPSKVDIIDMYSFFWCLSLKIIDLSNVVVIGRAAFGKCESLECVKLGNKLEIIDFWAFPDCLKHIYYDGTIADWNKVSKKDKLEEVVVHCKDGDTKFSNI